MRLVLHHARFLLYRSVLHCADAALRTHLPRASGKARLLPALPAFVPHSGTPDADSQSGIAPRCSAPCCAGPGCSRDFGASVAAASSPQSLPSPCGLVILNCSDLSAYITSPKSLPPARLPRAELVGVVPSFEVLCQSRKDPFPSPGHHRPAPDAPVGLSAQLLRSTAVTACAVTTAAHKSSSGGMFARLGVVRDFSGVFARAEVVSGYNYIAKRGIVEL